MRKTIMKRLLEQTGARLLVVAISLAILGSLLVVSLMSWLLKGSVTNDYLLTGFVTSLCISAMVSHLLIALSSQQRTLDQVKAKNEKNDELVQIISLENAAFKRIFDESPVPHGLNDHQGNIKRLNTAFIHTFGYELADIPKLEDWWKKAYPDPDYRAWISKTWQTRLAAHKSSGTPFEPLEAEIRCKDGSTKIVMASMTSTGDLMNDLDLVVLYDISSNKKTEALLRSDVERYRNLIDIAPFAIVIIDDTSTIIYGNKRAETLFAVTTDQVAGMTTESFYADITDRERIFHELSTGGTIDHQEIRIRDANGRKFRALVSSERIVLNGRNATITSIQDIEAQKLAEEASNQSAQFYRTLIETVATPVAVSDVSTGEVIFVNQRTAALFGVSNDMAAGQQVTNYYARPEQREEILAEIRQGRTVSDFELQMRRADGSVFWALLSGTLIQFDGKPALLTSVNNIDERKQAEIALRYSAQRYMDLIEKAPFPLVVTDIEDSSVIYVNRQAHALFDVAPGEAIGKPSAEFFADPEQHRLQRAALREHFDHGDYNVTIESQMRKMDGSLFWASTSVGLIEFDGRPASLNAIIDITERKKADDLIRQSALRYHNLIDNAPFPIVVTDLVNAGLLYANPRAEKLFGGELGNHLGESTSRYFVDPDFHQKLRLVGLEHLQHGDSSFEYEAQLRTTDGSLFWALLSLAFIEFEGESALITCVSDITTHKLAADIMQQSAQRYRNMIETAPFPIVVADIETGKILYDNNRAAALFGLTPEEGILTTTLDYYVDLNQRADLIHTLKQGHQVQDREIELKKSNGDRFWALISVTRTEFDGQPALLTSINDITDRKHLEIANEEARKLLQTVLETMPLRVFWKDIESRYLGCNPAFAADAGLASPAELIGKSDFDMGWKDQAELYRADDLLVMRSQRPKLGYIEPQTTPDGQQIWLETSKAPLLDAENRVIGMVGVYGDVTKRRQAEEKMALSARVFSEAHEGILITDATGAIIDINPTFTEITGYSREEVIGKNPSMLKSGRQAPEYYADMWNDLTKQGHWRGEVWNRKKDGTIYAELLSISALRDEQGRILHYIGLFSDITQSKNQQQHLELLANYDVLTRLPNRALFADRFNQALAHCKRDPGNLLAVCYLDLDGFKQVNDKLGHDAGDMLLVQVAERIKSMLREEDTVSRLGGDEFALLLGDIRSQEQCIQALERIHLAISKPYQLDSEHVVIGASSGVAIYPLDDADPDTLMRHADQAMYSAKLAGRNRFQLFDAASDQQLHQKRLKLEAIKEAFDRHEFQLYYQPKVHMKTGRIVGAEALIRWLHPERGLVPPMDFLPLVEGTPFESTLGQWVINQALDQIDQWNAQGLDLQVSVNISPNHLQKPDFLDQLNLSLEKHPGIGSRQFEIEVLESSVVEDISTITHVLKACSEGLGVSVALDDFGTGYSSLTHLRHLPANLIKIDQSFVRDMLDDPDDFAIIEGVIGLASAFRRNIIAEGVETEQHGLMLQMLGCPLAQGYAIARPMPASELPVWSSSYRAFDSWQNQDAHPQNARSTQLQLLGLEIDQWVTKLEACILANPDNLPGWPIMSHKDTHGGRWLISAQHSGVLDSRQLATLEAELETLHALGDLLRSQWMDDEAGVARGRLDELRALHGRISRRLQEWQHQ